MDVPVTQDMMNGGKGVDIRIEETTNLTFDLSETGQYVDIGEINGRLLIEYEINHGNFRSELERARNGGFREKINAFFEEWSLAPADTNSLDFDYGTLLFRGTEPLEEIPEQIYLTPSVSTRDFEQTSPEDLKRELRQEMTYSVAYDNLEEDISAYLSREGIDTDSFKLGAPVHIQARAEPIALDEQSAREQYNVDSELYGTKFTIKVDNKVPRRIAPSTMKVSMRPAIGRELVTLGYTQGSYDRAEQEYEFELPGINEATGQQQAERDIEFVVPQSAGADLEQISGSATLNTTQPFTNYIPEAVFDAGGRKIYSRLDGTNNSFVTVNWTCSIEAIFEAPTSEIMVGEGAQVSKKITIEGVPPDQAQGKIESILAQRGIDTDAEVSKEGTEMREGAEVAQYGGEFSGGSVVVDDTRILINIGISGERRTGEKSRERGDAEKLPAKRRNVTFEHGFTGLVIRGRGADTAKVESYLNDLRDELRLGLETMGEEI